MLRISLLATIVGSCLLAAFLVGAEKSAESVREAAKKHMNSGNYRDAYEAFEKLALDPNADTKLVVGDFESAIRCLQELGRLGDVDAFREKVIEVQAKNWRLLHAAARSCVDEQHFGYIVAGKFERGNRRGEGEMVNSSDRDRVRALQLMQQALGLLKNADESDQRAVSDFYLDFANFYLRGRGYDDAWQLQTLTNLAELPDYEPGYGYFRGGPDVSRGAPVDENGNPVYHHLPASYEAAATDGERWRWLLNHVATVMPDRKHEVELYFADFLHQQFGVQTLQQYSFFFAREEGDAKDGSETAAFALHTLGENETIARLATGIKRFTLPDEFSFIKILQQVADSGKHAQGEQALNTLAQIFEDRRQYPKAADAWRKSIAQYGPGSDNYKKERLQQIVGNWGRFENSTVQPAGQGATLEFRFRNATRVSFEAHRLKVDKLLDDVKAYLKSKPGRLDWEKMNIGDIGYRIVQQNQQQYLGERVANWDLDLTPRKDHFDSRVTVSTPMQKAGAYLVTAKVADGTTTRIIVWLDDTVMVRKPLEDKSLYFVADATTGRPVAGANVEFFGFEVKNVDNKPNQFSVLTKNFAEFTDADGQVFADPKQVDQEYQWIVTARTKEGRLAFLGFDRIWFGQRYDEEYSQTKVFIATDRPVYRPKQPVKFNVWVRHAKYDQEDVSEFADKPFKLRVTDPKGETVLEKDFQSDAYGGFSGEYELPDNATLGHYDIVIVDSPGVIGGGSFRVEEYKKPEFEVSVEAPSEPVMLGEKITATVRAKYYFGAPVTQAKVHYKVTRATHTSRWYPVGIWDWFYGPGYWWFAYDYEWYPGWRSWGCVRPHPFWWPQRSDPPEVVLDNDVTIGEDGTVKIEIDTALAKAIYGDVDHKYEVTAEVVDQSRRTIVGTGQVLVAREPFKVFAWVDRGYYRTGDTIDASFKAQTLDQKPVAGKGALSLLKITYDQAGKPVETEVESWKLDTDERGEASQSIKAAQAGQYRLSYKVTDAKGHTIEGGYVFDVIGQNFNGTAFRFNDLEIITDKREYEPGDKVRVMINTNRVGSTVVLFVRPTNGVYPRPHVLRLDGKSTIHEVEVVKKDMPNFFLEAFTISDGKLHEQLREVVVPPEKRVANVEVVPSSEKYKPGEEAKIKLKLTDLLGKPFIGSTVVTVYDKSVEYIAGGSNVPDIKEFFWKWRRQHYPQSQSTLQRSFYNLLKQGEILMGDLGAFGDLVEDESVADVGVGGFRAPGRGEKRSNVLGHHHHGRARGGPMQFKAEAAQAAPMADMAITEGVAAADSQGQEAVVQPTVRKEFADTAYWAVALAPDAEGLVELNFKMPENLTAWKIRAWTMGQGTKVGQGEADVVTTKNLLIRMQSPRFFVETDEVILSANVHNYLASAKKAEVVLELDGEQLVPLDELTRTVEIAAGGEARVDWRVQAARAGEAIVRMKALTDEESDAMEMRFPVEVHGMLKTESYTGVIRPDKSEATIEITVPRERRVSDARLEVRYSPSLAGALVDALPYLVSYPYKTTDTTLNRFLPTVITQNILKRMNVDLEDIKNKRANLNAQELGDPAERAKQWQRYKHNPVFDEAEVELMVTRGLEDLTAMQLSGGGWGWFSGWGEFPDPHTTALVVHGLQLAQQNGVVLTPGVLEKGVAWLKNYQAEQIQRLKNGDMEKKPNPYKTQADNLDALVFMVLVDADVVEQPMLDYLYRDRTKISVYAKGMFGLALHKVQDEEKLSMIVQNIDQFLVQDEENQTAYLKLPESYWWYWYGSETEANAYYLKLLAKTRPNDPKASRLVKYLLNNRKHATYWNSTRDTAIAIEAMADYMQASGEDRPDMTLEIYYDGKKQKEVQINAENLFTFDDSFDLVGDAIDSGVHTVELRKKGTGPVYYSAYLTNFTLEDFIKSAGLELKVNRKYYRLIRDDKEVKAEGSRGQAVDKRVEKYRREELPNLAELKSGDLVEIELEIDSKNDYEYIVFEDMKAAGFEPVEVQSGYSSDGMRLYTEFRDEKVTLFARTLARGKSSVSYRMRAEIPGRFSALPTKGYAMYAPELRGNSDEIKLKIVDK